MVSASPNLTWFAFRLKNEIGREMMRLNIKYIICKFRGYHVLDSTGMCVTCGKDSFGNGEKLILTYQGKEWLRDLSDENQASS